jgi:hypothetical protein
VWYDAANQRVQVWTYAPGQSWVLHGANIPVTLNPGDQFGARANSSGLVEVYRNGVVIGTANVASWPYSAGGGYIGLWLYNTVNTTVDDFGGG